MAADTSPIRIYGLTRSYFTRKLTGYFDYKGIPWVLRPLAGANPEVLAAGWPGGIPALRTAEGEFMWDSTAVIDWTERRRPEPSVLPPDPTHRFLCHLLEDLADEWLYRPAVGTRWFFEENAQVAGWELAREISCELPIACDQARELGGAHVRASCTALGVTAETIGAWVDEVLRPWQRALGAHLTAHPYLFGARPSLADFALFGGNAAHFVSDPVCRRWTEVDAPAVVDHTHRLLAATDQAYGDWDDAGVVPDTMIACLADAGRLYLPWVSRAVRDGAAEIAFASGARITVAPTDFLREAHATLLARYVALRTPALDRILERAGIAEWLAGATDLAGTIPVFDTPPRPRLNRPFPPEGA
jgi:glutathione S-transferase